LKIAKTVSALFATASILMTTLFVVTSGSVSGNYAADNSKAFAATTTNTTSQSSPVSST
jgi:hypothetical protein